MKGCKVVFLFFNTITAIFQHAVSEKQHTIGVNAVQKALQYLGITNYSSVDWKVAFAQLAMSYKQQDELLQEKDDLLYKVGVLNFVHTHLETLALELDPIFYTTKSTQLGDTGQEPFTLKLLIKNEIPKDDIPLLFRGWLETDFKTAYVKWYRIIMNSDDIRIQKLVTTLQTELRSTLTKQDIAKTLAILWCKVCNAIHSILGPENGLIKWENAKQVADAFRCYVNNNEYYVNFVRILFDVTNFKEHLAVTVST